MNYFLRLTGSLIAIILAAAPVFAQPNDPGNLNSEALRNWIKTSWYDPYFDDLGYNGARTQMFGYTDEENGEIEGIYTGYTQPSSFTTYLNPINTEHIVPQSFFGSISPMKSDLFNIQPTHGSANSARGNTPYGEVLDENAQWYGIDASGDYITQGNIPADPENWSERSGDDWEPREQEKGDIARMVFYFYTMYPTQAGAMAELGDPNMFYDWHMADPVDTFEATRNERIQEVQGNANPYVSHPEWVDLAWFWTGETVMGCTDTTACNYDTDANTDDGSCSYPESGFDCSGNPLSSCSLFFSEYAEGSSNNKYLEIYNPGLEVFSLDGIALAHTVNDPSTPGTYETWVELPANATIDAGDVFTIVHTSAATSLVNTADFLYGNLSNGDDGFALVQGTPTDFIILDIIGTWNADPGTGWDVAGVANATANHTLIRKPEVLTGNSGDWTASAGTTMEDSEWIVLAQDDWSNFGLHAADDSCDPSGGGDPSEVYGCTYPAACNHDISATIDDGSCDFASCIVSGCTYENALNFNMLATNDDGTCLFTSGESTCATDINGDGVITVADLLLLLTDFGAMCVN